MNEQPDAECAVFALNRAISEASGPKANPLPLLGEIANADPALAAALLGRASDHPDEPLTGHLGALQTERLPGQVAVWWESGDQELRRLAAASYRNDPRNLDADDQRRIRGMLLDDDDAVRAEAVVAISRLGQINRALALELGTSATPRNESELDWLLHGFALDEANDTQLAIVLGWLRDADRLGWEALETLKRIAPRAPAAVIELLIYRFRENLDVVGTSHHGRLLDGLDDASYRAALEAVREAALEPIVGWRLGFLVESIGRGAYSELLAVLEPWLVDADVRRVDAACALARELPWEIVLDQHHRVAAILERVATGPHLERVRGAFLAAADGGITGRSHGEPAQDDVIREQRCKEIADELPDGAGKAFYADLAHYFRQKIQAELSRDEEEDLLGV
jgi:hypothetical protein